MSVPSDQIARYRALVAVADRRLEGAPPQEVLSWALDEFGDQLCVTASMGDALLIDMASRIRSGVNIVFLDTGYHFADTLDTRDRVAKRYPIALHSIVAKQSVAEQDETFGPRLHDRDADACCSLRKVEPLNRALDGYLAWASGVRRDESETRRDTDVVGWDRKRSMVKINPLACWTQRQVDEYIIANDVEVNPLVYDGYPSIGCAPCTARVLPGQDPRSGRWVHDGKTECGIHLG